MSPLRRDEVSVKHCRLASNEYDHVGQSPKQIGIRPPENAILLRFILYDADDEGPLPFTMNPLRMFCIYDVDNKSKWRVYADDIAR